MNKKIKKSLRILTILLILLLLIIFVIKIYNRIMIRIHQDDLIYDDSSNKIDEIEYPFMAYKFFVDYDGEIESDDIVAYVYNVANNVIPNYYTNLKNFSTKEIDSFFEENEKDILDELGTSKEEFEEFILKIQQIDSENLIFKSYQVDTESLNYTQSFSYFDLIVEYEDGNKITINVKVRNKYSESNTNLKVSIK
jgi:hypothetical protein